MADDVSPNAKLTSCVVSDTPMSTSPSYGWFRLHSWLRWRPTSPNILEMSEKRVLSNIRSTLECKYVPINNGCRRIWTVIANKSKNKIPLIMVHGFGGGVGLWSQNIDDLSDRYPLYMMDLLGFGRSSRPHFSTDPAAAEKEFVDSLENWRSSMNLDKFVLLGHSLGAFIAASYAINYPNRVKHLILVDAWGFPKKPPEVGTNLPIWIRAIAAMVRPFNPLAVIRAVGPCGPGVVKKFRGDLGKKYTNLEDENIILEYIYHCNAQNPSGESAFKSMTESYGWAKNPMIHRIADIHCDVPITMIYGSRSWINAKSGYDVKSMRAESYVDVKVISGAGHHVYADRAFDFNKIVIDICESVNSHVLTEPTPVKYFPSDENMEDNQQMDVIMALNMDDGADKDA